MATTVDPASTYRVVQWATGNIGTRSLRAVIEHPRLDLVGLWVHSPDKVGLDAGELCGVGPVGVAATGSIDDVLGLEPDCVLSMPQGCDFDQICRLLEAGIDVVTTRGEFHHPGSMRAEDRERVEAACARGGSSIHSTGISPGFISEAIPIVLTSIQRRLDGLHIEEFANLESRNSPDLLFRLMGFASDPDAFDERRWAHGAASFGPSLRLIAESVGLPLDSVEASGELGLAIRDVEIAAGTVPAGTVAAQRMIVSGRRNGEVLLSFSATWYCCSELDVDWDLQDGGWHVVVEGDCPLDISIRLAIPVERMAETTPGYTANRAVNAVPVVCAAEPGIRTTVDLPHVLADLGATPSEVRA